MTTNKPDELDSALTRKGRVDLALKVDFPRVLEVQEYMSDFYGSNVHLPIGMDTRAHVGMSAIQDVCVQNDLASARKLVLPMFLSSNGHAIAVVAA